SKKFALGSVTDLRKWCFRLLSCEKCYSSIVFLGFLHLGDGDDEFTLYPSDNIDDACGSDGDPSSALAEDPASPSLSNDKASPLDLLSLQHPTIFLPQEGLPIPLDFELRESAVAGGGLGIWSCRKVNIGERFGPYEGEHRACLRDTTQGWKVGT
uniref:Uncharacterized protein n=1 Tax=Monopterus albus TaxID=43700 RepID=A0A3Q3J190_MONAL